MIRRAEPFEEYLAAKQYLSSSDIVHLLKGPSVYHYFRQHHSKQEKEEKKHFKIGRAFHCAVAEKDKYEALYPVLKEEDRPDKNVNMTGKKNRAWKLEIQQRAIESGGALLTKKEAEDIKQMVLAARKNPLAVELMSQCTGFEESYYAHIKVEDMEVPVRCRPDMVAGTFFLSLKSAQSSKPEDFYRHAGSLFYHAKEAFYWWIMSLVRKHLNLPPLENAHFIVCETQPPFFCEVFQMAPIESRVYDQSGYSPYISTGMHLVNVALRRYKQMNQEPFIPKGYGGAHDMFLPNYYENIADNLIQSIKL
jgi:hypothetical protein